MTVPMANLFDRIMSERRNQYWALQAVGWSGYSFFIMVGPILWGKGGMAGSFSYAIMAALLGIMLTEWMHKAFKLTWDNPPVKRMFQTLLIVGTATGLWAGWKIYVYVQMHMKTMHNPLAEYLYWYSYSMFILLSWTGLYFGIKYYQMVQEEREKNLRITNMAHQAQLKMLRYQINPHFLFNTLNSISTLVMEKDSDVANKMVSGLSKFLRYSLDSDPMQKVTLEQEVKAMGLYLDIEKIRFGDRLHMEFEIDERASQALVPSMLLQPLIENSIKYAIAKSENGGTIRLSARIFGNDLLLELADDGPGLGHSKGDHCDEEGVGLTNSRERLQNLYGEDHAFQLVQAEPKGLQVNIRIPHETDAYAGPWKN